MNGPVIGECKLCLRDPVVLENSHFLSAGIYRQLRDENGANPNPWLVTSRSAVQTSRQMTAHLLCRDCEKRFSNGGERWVLTRCSKKDGTFPLASVLSSRIPDLSSSESQTKVYFAARIPKIDISALAYFAASIFWRGSIYGWDTDGSVPVKLGPFPEQFRRYRMGSGPFPLDSRLWIAVREGKKFDRVTYPPCGGRIDKVHVYKFPMPGLAFTLTVSKNIPDTFKNMCFVSGPGNPIVVTPVVEELILRDAVKLYQRTQRVYSSRRDDSDHTFRMS